MGIKDEKHLEVMIFILVLYEESTLDHDYNNLHLLKMFLWPSVYTITVNGLQMHIFRKQKKHGEKPLQKQSHCRHLVLCSLLSEENVTINIEIK